LQSRLDASVPAQRLHVIDAFLREQARAVLGLDARSGIDDHRPLKELGLDSLMAVELRNAIVAAAGRPLPATLLFDHPTLAALRDHLCDLLLPSDRPASPHVPTTQGAASNDNAAAVAAMSEADAQAQLLAELGLDDSRR
jgi:acyl carrier protein